jgi:hypothetical protein
MCKKKKEENKKKQINYKTLRSNMSRKLTHDRKDEKNEVVLTDAE